jgi:hypothetical protein
MVVVIVVVVVAVVIAVIIDVAPDEIESTTSGLKELPALFFNIPREFENESTESSFGENVYSELENFFNEE